MSAGKDKKFLSPPIKLPPFSLKKCDVDNGSGILKIKNK